MLGQRSGASESSGSDPCERSDLAFGRGHITSLGEAACWWMVGKTVLLYGANRKLDPMGGWITAPKDVNVLKTVTLYGKWAL